MAFDTTVLENDIIFLTETQLLPHTDVSSITETLCMFNFEFNSSDHKFSSLAVAHNDNVQIIDHEKHPGVSIVTISAKAIHKVLKIALIYRINTSSILNFCSHLQYFLSSPIVVGGNKS